jgi:glycyl-tRNA synthetase beta chain
MEAAKLAKTDLTTELVKEFTELQGIVGGLYARAQFAGEHTEAIAQAIYWQYMPAAVTDAIPPTPEGQLLGLADRFGTIVDMFGIGLAPTGSKDPYALRRAANAVVKILAVGGLPLTVRDLLAAAGGSSETQAAVLAFFEERLSFYLREVAGLRADVVNAVLLAGSHDVADAQARGNALQAVRGSDDLAAISAAWKRTKNILRQAGNPAGATVQEALLRETAEQALWHAVSALLPEVEALRKRGEYTQALERIAKLRPQVDAFFDTVMVMAEEPEVRANRLALLSVLVGQLGRIADFSEIAPGAAE